MCKHSNLLVSHVDQFVKLRSLKWLKHDSMLVIDVGSNPTAIIYNKYIWFLLTCQQKPTKINQNV